MTEFINTITSLGFLAGFSASTILFVCFAVFFYLTPGKFDQWTSKFLWLLSHIWKRAQYYAVKSQIQGDVNSSIRELEKGTTLKFPKISIEWTAKNDVEDIVWEQGEAIILMRDRKYKIKNVVHAVHFFTSSALLRRSKNHLSQNQKQSLDLFATFKILQRSNVSALDQFMNDYFSPSIERSEQVKEFIGKYTNIEKIGVFFPILIQELSCLGGKVFLNKRNREVVEEVNGLVNFLEDFSQREVGDDQTTDTFLGRYTRCAIKIVASKWTRGRIIPHKARIVDALKKQLENVYVIGNSDKENRDFMNDVVDSVLDEFENVRIEKTYRFSGKINIQGETRNVKTYLIHLRNPEAVRYIYEEKDIEL